MSQYRSELRVPVELDRRSFAEKYRPRSDTEDWLNRSPYSQTGSSSRSTFQKGSRLLPWHRHFDNQSGRANDLAEGDEWFEEMQRRFDERRRQWDEDVRRMRQEFFTPGLKDERMTSGLPNLLLPSSKFPSTRPFSSSYENAPDGSLNFVANFEVSDFQPDDLHVSVKDKEILVTAKTEKRSDGSTSTREYSRSVRLPNNADDELVTAALSSDGVLTITCPIKPPPFTRITGLGDSDARGVASPQSPSSLRSGEWGERIQANKSELLGRAPIHEGGSPVLTRAHPKFRLELPIDSDYSPAEIQIRTLNRRIYVTARHEERGSNRTAVREFSKEYDIPDSVDPECLEAKFENGMLYIEAVPL
ncbi:unnamed protein product [Calicophoron daubneyi]|uniref:SHSP domain-containing protein n=1 Tax=Calicophoron daubneyi TaxID=300641 RepID=A0AAV2T6S2_CALDB